MALSFETVARDGEETRTITGRFETGAPDWVYLPVPIRTGVREIAVDYTYDRPKPPPGLPGNALDIGIFDASGGFRGWSGGARESFNIAGDAATPGYLPGPIGRGTWNVVLGPYSVAPQGMAWTVRVTSHFGEPGTPFVPMPAPPSARGRGRAWYRGDMHLHTVHSDGRWRPEELADAARAAGLDFIVSTEHNTSSAAGVWGRHARDDLLIIDGEEITTRNGHYTALGLPAGTWIDWRYRAVDGAIPRYLKEIHHHSALAVAAHPFSPPLGCQWKFGYEHVDAVEVWNGPWTPDDEMALRMWDGLLTERRTWLPAVGDSDSHGDHQPVGLPHNVVLADDLSRTAVLAAVQAGHLYVAESAAVSLEFSASTDGSGRRRRAAGIGERLRADAGEDVTVALAVRGVPSGTVRLCTDEGQIAEEPIGGDGAFTWRTTPRASAYVRVEARHEDGTMAALTNPIFLR